MSASDQRGGSDLTPRPPLPRGEGEAHSAGGEVTSVSANNATQPTGPTVICPFCGSSETEPLALFGSQLSTTQHYCRACHTPFERFKQDAPQRDPERQGAAG